MPKGRRLQFLLILFFTIFYISNVNANYTVCDSWSINFTWSWVIEICNWWTMTGSIILINDFEWNFINFDMWYWWNNYDFNNSEIDIVNSYPLWYFDENNKTIITKLNPQNDNTVIWYWWNNYDFSNSEINIKNSYPVWFFDTTKITYINNINSSFDTPTGFLWSYILPDKKSSWRRNVVIHKDTYREYFEEIFRLNYYLAVINWNNKQKDYNIFVKNILDLFMNWNEYENKVIDEVVKNRIKLEIEKGEFKNKLTKLVLNLKEINFAFENTKTNSEKFYILKYYLNE